MGETEIAHARQRGSNEGGQVLFPVSLMPFERTTRRLRWANLVDVRKIYAHADTVDEFTVFNTGGNQHRLVTYINYRTGRVYIRHVMTHEEYGRKDSLRIEIFQAVDEPASPPFCNIQACGESFGWALL
jgi:mRNA interferase HigB